MQNTMQHTEQIHNPMKTIHFKNGATQEVNQDDIRAILDHIDTYGYGGFHSFVFEKEIYLVINISEIVFIS